MIVFDREVCNDFAAATSREWLETNGIGGFAMGSLSGANTRRYHALLTAATRPPLGRIKTLSKIEETLEIDAKRFELSTNQYPGLVHPAGFEYLKSFRLDPFPIWVYEVDGLELEKRLFMPHGENTVVIRYTLKTGVGRRKRDVQLHLRPLLSFIDYHALQRENAEFDTSFDSRDGVVSVRPYSDLPELHFFYAGNLFASSLGSDTDSPGSDGVETTGYWYKNLQYPIEQERGFDFEEDLYQPFQLTFELSKPAEIVATTESGLPGGGAKLEKAEIKRRPQLVKTAKAKDDFSKQLVLAADQFIVKRGDGHTVIAGYPWFSDWGRDTMIALPGLTLATNRPDIAKGILLEFAENISEGMLPNRFADADGEAEYNTVDATLWFFEAVRAYLEHTNDHRFVGDGIYPKLVEIVTAHLRGTRYNIHVDTDGLLYSGSPSVQLTWMDAKIGDFVVTPRTGKAVEIQALWYNALRIMQNLAERFGDDEAQTKYGAMADLARLSFNGVFWNDAENCLYDVVENGDRDGSVRPNQIFAASLTHSMLDDDRARRVIEKLEAELLTPFGLRTLSPRDPRYVPVYVGSPLERDSAYHQGTVWPWLLGGYADAVKRFSPEKIGRVNEVLDSLAAHLHEAGLGQVSEIFDADPPHSPRGCPAQAWTVAEMLRILKRT
jgi:predicted glycogen debranching enzyme